MQVTVMNTNQNLDFIQIGEVLTFKKIEDRFNKEQICAYYNGNEIGRISATVTMAVPGTQTNKDIYEKVPDEFSGTVVDNTKSIATTTTQNVLVVEITGVSNGQSTSTNGTKIFTFIASGSSTKYPGKVTIHNEFNSQKQVFVQLKVGVDSKSNEPILIAYRKINGQEIDCGKIADDELGKANISSKDDYELIKLMVTNGQIFDARVINALATKFTFQIEVPNVQLQQFQTQVVKQAVGTVKQDLIDKGFDENTLNDIEDYLTANKFSATEIQNIFKSYKMYPPEVAFRIKKRPKTLFNDSFQALRVCYASFLNSYHILCSGDKGTGKNCLISTWAWVLQRPLYEISINRDTDKMDMMGAKTLDSDVNEEGKVVDKITFQPEVLLEAMEVGGIINIDEVNFADPGITSLLHSIADDRREVQVPGYKKVAADENFFIMGTMNIDYQGTNELNEALADRFVDINFPPNESIAIILNANCPKSPQTEIQICDNIYKNMYSTIENRDSSLDSKCLTVRGFIQALNMSPVLGLKKALTVCVADKVKDQEYHDNIIEIINSKCR